MTDQAPVSPEIRRAELEASSMRAGRLACDFALQAIQRTVVLATVMAAAKVTGSALIDFVSSATLLLFFAWSFYSVAGAARWLLIRLPGIRRPQLIWLFLFAADIVITGFLILTATGFADEMAIRFAS